MEELEKLIERAYELLERVLNEELGAPVLVGEIKKWMDQAQDKLDY